MFQEFFFEIQIEKLFAVSYQVPFQDLPLVVIVNVLFILVRLSLGVSVRRVGGLLRVEPLKRSRENMGNINQFVGSLSFFKGYFVFRNMAFEAAIHRAKGILFSGPPSSLFSFDKISIRRKMPSSRGKEKFFFLFLQNAPRSSTLPPKKDKEKEQ